MNTEKRYNSFVLYATFLAVFIYIFWRIAFTIPTDKGAVSLIAGLFLVTCELAAALEALLMYVQAKRLKPTELPEIPEQWYPGVDMLIATHNESTELLYKTANACTRLDYPDKSLVHVYICDDNDRPEMAALAGRLGVGYFGLSGNKQAKAGNLNNALSKTSSPLVVVVDADMILRKNFLMRTVPYFFLPRVKKTSGGRWMERSESEIDPDYKIGFVQTPQSFYNPDLFQFNLFSENRIPNEQDYFFREVNVIRSSVNAPIYAGTNAVISREALEEVGYISTGSITEDFETGIKIQMKGYRTLAVDDVLAQGLAPTSLKSLLGQRERWGRGCVQSLSNVRFLSDGKLPLLAKFSYVSVFLYWWTFFRRFVYILSPILFALFNVVIVDAPLEHILMFWLPYYLLYNHTLRMISGNIRNRHWSNVVDVILFPYMMMPVMFESFGIKQRRFVVTEKKRSVSADDSRFLVALPHIMLFAASVLSVITIVKKILESGTASYYLLIMFWLVVNAKDLLFAIFFMLGRKNFRNHERFYVKLPVRIDYDGAITLGNTSDISESGMCVILLRPEYLPYDEDFDLRVEYDGYSAGMKGTVAHVASRGREWRYSVRITEIDEPNRREYMQIVYDRHHSLPTQLGDDWGMFDDFNLNLGRRTKSLQNSMRALPRISAKMPFKANGGVISGVILNFNYHYAAVELESYYSSNADFAKNLTVDLPGGVEMVLDIADSGDSPGKGRLYAVRNWRELARDASFARIVDSWVESDASWAASEIIPIYSKA
jgi:cellulose synthase (UDP-forming)